MSASKTGLPKYRRISGADYVYAARVGSMVPFTNPGAPAGSQTLWFSDSPKKVNLIGDWINANNPAVGGYFLVEDDAAGQTTCRYLDAATFASEFTPA